MENLKYSVRRVYGKDLIYPANAVADTFCAIARMKTLDTRTLKLAASLGFKLEQVMEPCAVSIDSVKLYARKA